MNVGQYFECLVQEFPKIKKEVEDEDSDMIHMKMEIFAEYTIQQIKSKNTKELVRCFEFQESRIDLMNSLLENALNVSYCESMLLGEVSNQMDQIIEIMPIKLKEKYLAYENYYFNLLKSTKM